MTTGRIGRALAFLLPVLVFAAGCAGDKPPRSYVQANVVDKAYFTGEWWYSTKVIDVNYPFEGMTYPGDSAYDISGGGFSVSRIRWVVDESFLYAFRSYELVEGSNPGATVDGKPADGYIGEPVAAYKIASHFDIKRQYNPTTGEQYNVIEENTVDRKWFERRYMRVDWSQNLMISWMVNGAELYSDAGILDKESVPMFVQDESQWETYFPASWKPNFAFADADFDAFHKTHYVDDPATPEKDGDYREGELYFMSFVNQAIYTPGMVPDPYTGEPVPWCMSAYVDAPICTSNLVTTRSSFLKISPDHEYEPLYYPDRTRDDRFGAFRVERITYDDNEGGPGDPSYGETDFLGYYASRFKTWDRYRDADGNMVPYRDREISPIVFHLSKETPRWLVRPGMLFMIDWNEVFMTGARVNMDQGTPARGHGDMRNWFSPPDPDKRDLNCWIAAVGAGGRPEALEDPLALDEAGNPVRTVTGWADFAQENRLAFFHDPGYSFTAPDGSTVTPGSECLVQLHVNACDLPLEAFPAAERDAIAELMADNDIASLDDVTDDQLASIGIECEERGDMRYKLISYIEMPGAPFLGVTSIQSDPVTGEIICGDSNIAAWDLHRYRVRAGDEIDLTSGDTSELEYMTGQDVKGFFEGLGYALPPPGVVAPEDLQAQVKLAGGVSAEGIHKNMRRVMARAAKLKGAAGKQNLLSYRRELLHGTDIERRMLDNDDALAAAGIARKVEGAPLPLDAIIDSISPFNVSAMDVLDQDMNRFMKFSKNNVHMMNSFIDYSVQNFVAQHESWPRTNLVFYIEQILYAETLIHEFGHTINLRHNMRGTADPWNYPEPYYDIVARYPKPRVADFDADRDGELDTTESAAYRAAAEETLKKRELNEEDPAIAHWGSMDRWMTSSVMDYTGQWYSRMTDYGYFLGPYDKAATIFAYNDAVEVIDNRANRLLAHCHDPTSGRNEDCFTPDKFSTGEAALTYWTYYGGAELCAGDADCPYSADGSHAALLKEGQVAQRCASGLCSNFYADVKAAYPGERPDFFARDYKFCTDERRTDIGMDDSQCNIFDEGGTYREIVENMRKTYHRKYLFNNFRRFQGRYDFYPYYQSIVGRFFLYPVKIFQDMIYRYATDEAYRTDTGPFGFYDQYMASVDLMNFWNEVMSWPDLGDFRYDKFKKQWTKNSEKPEKCQSGMSCVKIDLGLGKYAYSRYQTGLNGIQRVEYFGTIYDKMFAQQMLLLRDMAFNYSPDEAFYVNFYDVFPEEIVSMLRGQITEDAHAWKPRVVRIDDATRMPTLQYPDLYRGNCMDSEKVPDPGDPEVFSCRPDPLAAYAGLEPIEDGATFYVQMYGLIFGLSDLPVYFDTAPQEMLHIYKVGSLFDADIPPGAVDGVDYVTFTSDKTRQTYLAFQVDDLPGKWGGSIAFDLVKKCKDMQANRQDWIKCFEDETPGACGFDNSSDLGNQIFRATYDLSSFESMINYAIEVQQMFGIKSWMGYSSAG